MASLLLAAILKLLCAPRIHSAANMGLIRILGQTIRSANSLSDLSHRNYSEPPSFLWQNLFKTKWITMTTISLHGIVDLA